MKLFKKRDLILAGVILLLAAAALMAAQLARRVPAIAAEVSVDGIVVETLDLSRDTELTVTGSGGGTNHLIVKNGQIWCSQASCPDEVCVRQGKKQLSSDSIVCLPNKMIVTIVGGKQLPQKSTG